MHDDHDDLHDRGLLFDLASIDALRPPPRIERRGALKLLAGAGAGLVLVACGSDNGEGSAASSSTTTTTTGASTTTTSGSSSGGSTDAIPQETGGPFPGDGSNGPNVLTESGVVREDIRSSFGGYSGTATGVPLTVALQVVEASTGQPLDGAAVYLWHCTADGGYSLYSAGVTDQNFLRGVQAADADGNLGFTTVFPGCYSGRWPHMHFEVFSDLDAASAGQPIVTSQLALPEGACHEVYASDGYEASVSNLASLSLESDNVFSDGWEQQLATVDGDLTSGYTATLLVPV